MTLKELGKRVIEVLSSNKGGTVPQEWLDGLEELGRRIVKALNNKRGSWGLPPSEGEVIAQALMPDNRRFEQIIADAGYESSENYLYLEENGQKCFIKPQNYEISKKRSYKANPYTVENMEYNEKKDEYTCPNGRKLKFKRESKKTTENGYVISTRYYSNDKCGRCPHREKCHSSKNRYRTVRLNQVLNEYRPKTLEALTSEEGALLRMNRYIQVEGVFGVLKEDYGFRRFLTRGKLNIETQFFLLAFALNIEKLCNREKKGRFGLDLFKLNAS